jgi:hypothetical protein
MDRWEDDIRSGEFKQRYEEQDVKYQKNLALNKDPDGAAGPDGHFVRGKLAFQNSHLQKEPDPCQADAKLELTKEIVVEVEGYAAEYAKKYFDLYVERGGRA